MTGVLFLFCLGFLGLDLSSKKGQSLKTISIFGTESLAFGCGSGYLNHQEVDPKATVCFGSGGPTDFTVMPYNDCKDSWNSCCPFPGPVPTCPSIGG